MDKVMDIAFSLFNCHINNASKRAKTAFIKRFSQQDWDKNIQPFIDEGVMSIFQTPPNDFTKWYVEAVAIFVNENV